MKTIIIVIALASILLFWMGYSGYLSRRIIDKIFPCVEHPEITSFPCNAIWDLWLMAFAGLVFAFCIIYLGYEFYIISQSL